MKISPPCSNVPGKTAIYVWPCGTWCHSNHIEEYTFMSDDYMILWVPEELDDEAINIQAHNIIKYIGGEIW